MNLRKALSTLLAAAMMCSMLCVSAFAAEEETPDEAEAAPAVEVVSVVEVTVGALYVRTGGGVDYPAVSTVHRGDICELSQVAYNWGKLANGAGWIYLGYTKEVSDVAPAEPVEEPAEPAAEPAEEPAAEPVNVVAVVEITVGALNVRSGGGVDSPVVSAVRRGDICELSQVAYNWGKLANGAGWIYLGSGYTKEVSDVEPAAPAEPAEPAEEPAPVEEPAEPAAEVVSVVEITVGALYVRTGGGVDYPAVSAVHRGDICELSQVAYNWGKLANGAGWIYLGSGYTKTVEAAEPAAE